MPNSLPAPDPRSAIPGATRPTIISGMEKLRKLLKMELMVTKMRTPGVGRKAENDCDDDFQQQSDFEASFH